jgi:hypothetical protein
MMCYCKSELSILDINFAFALKGNYHPLGKTDMLGEEVLVVKAA